MKNIKSLALLYLRIMAKIQLIKIRPIIVGVGGASGKTSLANFISIILKERYKILETKGKNSQTGIPLSILRLKLEEYSFIYWIKVMTLALLRVIFDWKRFDILVAELGIDGPYEPTNMSYLLKIVRPQIGILTDISFEHSQYFEAGLSEDMEGKIKKILDLTSKQEALLLQSLPNNGLAVLNMDNDQIRKIKGIKANTITVSSNKKTDFIIENVETKISEFVVKFSSKQKKYGIKIKNPLPTHYASSFLLAVAAVSYFGFSVEDSIKILEKNFYLSPGRISIFKGIKNTTIIDSTYNNATLMPMIDLLDLLKTLGEKKRKVAIVGDMRELGLISKDYHEKVANKLLKTSDMVILIGEMMKKYAAPILKKNKHKFYSFETFSEVKKTIRDSIERNDIILVKGSQNKLFLERVVEMLLKEKKDVSKLCRRGKYWDKRRRETP